MWVPWNRCFLVGKTRGVGLLFSQALFSQDDPEASRGQLTSSPVR